MIPTTQIPSLPTPQTPSVQIGRRANMTECLEMKTLTREHFDAYAQPVDPRFAHVNNAKVPVLTTILGHIRSLGIGLKMGVDVVKGGNGILTERGTTRTPKMLDSWLNRQIKHSDDFASNADKSLFHLVKGEFDILVARLSPTQYVAQMNYDESRGKHRLVPGDSPVFKSDEPDQEKTLELPILDNSLDTAPPEASEDGPDYGQFL